MIYVFKTSVKNKKAGAQLKPQLDNLLQGTCWNFDLYDCDKILRIETQSEISQKAIKIWQDNGFDCEELVASRVKIAFTFT